MGLASEGGIEGARATGDEDTAKALRIEMGRQGYPSHEGYLCSKDIY
jgi:hypothetical protein